jgi:transposase
LVEKVEAQFKIETSKTALGKALDKMEVTWKNVLPMLTTWNTPEVLQQRAQFVNKLGGLSLTHRQVIYIDESGFNMHTRKSKGRALVGEKATLTLAPKGKRVTVIAALAKIGFLHHKLVLSDGNKPKGQRGTNAEHFRSFLMDLITKAQEGALIWMDNCKIHHTEAIDDLRALAWRAKRITIDFTAPYSPFLNPIEYAFNKLKTNVAQDNFKNTKELMDTIERNIPEITADDAEGFFRQAAKYYDQALLGLPFTGKPLQPEIPLPTTTTTMIHPTITNV